MRATPCLCVLLVAVVFISCVEARKTFSTRRKTGNSRRGGSTNFKHKQPPPPVTPQKVDSFLAAERAGSSHGSSGATAITNTHYRGSPFDSKPPKQTVPQTNGPIGFEKVNQGNTKPLGFDKVNSEVQQKSPSSNVPSAPVYPGKAPAQPSAPNGPPPAYPGLGSNPGSHGGFEPPPAYPGRPVNAPPVYSANNPSYSQRPAYPAQQNYPGQQNYPSQQSYSGQQNYPGQHSYPGQQNYPGQQSYSGQQNYPGYNTGSYGGYPNQGLGTGAFGSYPSSGYNNWHSGQSNPGGFGGNPYGGSPFGNANPYGGSPFGGHSQFGGNPGFGGNPHYSPNNFGFSNNPGFFGSSSYPGSSGKYGNFMGQHKKSRWGGLPIPIPIPIPIPLGGFGGFGGRSNNHRVLDTFIKNQTINSSNNETTNIYILNNTTVTPCTTDQFIYDSLNVTVVSCTAGNCTAVKVFTTTNVSGEIAIHSAGITMCLEDNNITYSSFADNVNPTVSDLHKYWMRVCREGLVTTTNTTENVTEQVSANVTVKIDEIPIKEIFKTGDNATMDISPDNTTVSLPVETTTVSSVTSVADNSTSMPLVTSSIFNTTALKNNSLCEIFNCSWIEMCLPAIELVDRCSTQDCPFTRTGYRPCVRIKMCKSPSTPISTFATLNNTISRIDQFNNISSVSDVANLTLISYVPPIFPVNCSQNASDPACLPPVNIAQEVCASNNTSLTNGTLCVPSESVPVPSTLNTTEAVVTLTTESTTNVPDFKNQNLELAMLEELKQNLTQAYKEMSELRAKLESEDKQQS